MTSITRFDGPLYDWRSFSSTLEMDELAAADRNQDSEISGMPGGEHLADAGGRIRGVYRTGREDATSFQGAKAEAMRSGGTISDNGEPISISDSRMRGWYSGYKRSGGWGVVSWCARFWTSRPRWSIEAVIK